MHTTANNFGFMQTPVLGAVCGSRMITPDQKKSESDYALQNNRHVGYMMETPLLKT